MGRVLHVLAFALLPLVPASGLAQQVVEIPARDRALQGQPQTLYSIGALEGEHWETFGSVAQVAFDARDNLYVLDRGNHRVLVFDADGRFVRQLGKQGGGPGEFGSPIGLVVQADGTVIVSDASHRNYVVFRPDGEFDRTVPYDPELGMFVREVQGHPRGGVLAQPGGMRRGPDGPQPYDSIPVLWTRLEPDAEPVRLAAVPAPQTRMTSSGAPGGGMRVMVSGPPVFSPQFRWGALPNGGLALSYETDYAVQIAGEDGGIERVIRRPFRARKVTEADRERARERRRAQLESGSGIVRVSATNAGTSTTVGGRMPQQQIDQNLASMEFAEIIPVIYGLRTDPQARIWVQRAAEKEYGPGPIDLIGADGRYIGTLTGQTLPAAVSAGGRAAYVETDEYDVERVVVKMLPAGWR